MTNRWKKGRAVRIRPTDMTRSGHCRPVKGVRRAAPEPFPAHVAVHEVTIGGKGTASPYSEPHAHRDEDEVNLLIGKGSLRYRISLDGKAQVVSAPAAVWIPAGVRHSANAVSGKGYFVCVRFRKPAANRGKSRS